jgi:hypothetical protein
MYFCQKKKTKNMARSNDITQIKWRIFNGRKQYGIDARLADYAEQIRDQLTWGFRLALLSA